MINRQNWGMVAGAVLLGALLWVLIIWGISRIVADAATRSGEHAPECVHWRVIDNSGNGPLVRVLVCGTGSNGESPARDDTNWQTLIVDGDAFHTDGCGTNWTTNPCVVLWPGSPQGVKATT